LAKFKKLFLSEVNMASRKMEYGKPVISEEAGMNVVNKKLTPQGTPNSANDPVKPTQPNDLSQFPDVQGMTRGSATDILKALQKANKTK
tara:strand:+ start:2569 stop:2835 length:267 start_codon:yes stop_codon:yes gene_type:complete